MTVSTYIQPAPAAWRMPIGMESWNDTCSTFLVKKKGAGAVDAICRMWADVFIGCDQLDRAVNVTVVT